MTQCNCDHSDSSGFSAGLMLGLILGGAGGYYLSTPQGQDIVAKLKGEAGDKLKEMLDSPEISTKLAELESTMQEARAVINQTAVKVATATEVKEPKKTFFQRAGLSLGK